MVRELAVWRIGTAGEYLSEMELDFMVMHRSCSSSLVSMYRSFPANRMEMIPFEEMRLSVMDVLPWSTCARTHMFRTLKERSVGTAADGRRTQTLQQARKNKVFSLN